LKARGVATDISAQMPLMLDEGAAAGGSNNNYPRYTQLGELRFCA